VTSTDDEGATILHVCAGIDGEHHVQLLSHLVSTYKGMSGEGRGSLMNSGD